MGKEINMNLSEEYKTSNGYNQKRTSFCPIVLKVYEFLHRDKNIKVCKRGQCIT